MGRPQARKGNPAKNKAYKKAKRTRHRAKDVDQIQDEIKLHSVGKLTTVLDPDLPAMGQIACLPCARYFVSEAVLREHCRAKDHKKRLKTVAQPQYTQDEADRAAGMGSFPV
ncbi:C2H2-type domain-containing protein [Plasmodiophora brassicae]|uniref:C2H2-type domain-containing protein n=1 Tax=Plasmodiophora brassicae TaxID=37360 RepID=A0A0G4IRS5_PLABS|nr:hypothetical protein PBRA_005968 [Plasmodiophora brassicae]SPQ98074.1 unnamed protein product [Plasmodiophora brassicae]